MLFSWCQDFGHLCRCDKIAEADLCRRNKKFRGLTVAWDEALTLHLHKVKVCSIRELRLILLQ